MIPQGTVWGWCMRHGPAPVPLERSTKPNALQLCQLCLNRVAGDVEKIVRDDDERQ